MYRPDLMRMMTRAQEAPESINVQSVLREAAEELEYLTKVETHAKFLWRLALDDISMAKDIAEDLTALLRPQV